MKQPTSVLCYCRRKLTDWERNNIGTFMNEFKESLLKEMTGLLKTELRSVKSELKNVSMNQRNMYNYLVTSSRGAAAIPTYTEYSENVKQ
jgi:hypothetical protein